MTTLTLLTAPVDVSSTLISRRGFMADLALLRSHVSLARLGCDWYWEADLKRQRRRRQVHFRADYDLRHDYSALDTGGSGRAIMSNLQLIRPSF